MSRIVHPAGWTSKPFSKATTRIQTGGGKLKTKEYQESGCLPIVDQGQNLVVAYTGKRDCLFQGPYPVIVFGDHTKNVKLVDFEFAVGADGVVLLRPADENELDIRFLYYWLKYIPLHNLGYSRHFKLLKEQNITYPVNLNEQYRIVARIEELTRRAEEAQKLRQEASKEVANLFQIELEIFFSPQEMDDWIEYDGKQVFDIVRGQIDPKEKPYIDLPHIAPNSIESGTGRLLKYQVKTPRELHLKSGKYHFNSTHVLYSKIRPNLRKVTLPDFKGTCSADMYPLIPNLEVVTRGFLTLALLALPFTRYAVENSDRNAMPKINRPTLLEYRMKLPSIEVQQEFVSRVKQIQTKANEIIVLQNKAVLEIEQFQPALLAKAFRGEL